MLAVGCRDITTKLRKIHLDNRATGQRGVPGILDRASTERRAILLEAGKVSEETVDGMRVELDLVAHDPNAVFFYSFVQTRARVW